MTCCYETRYWGGEGGGGGGSSCCLLFILIIVNLYEKVKNAAKDYTLLQNKRPRWLRDPPFI